MEVPEEKKPRQIDVQTAHCAVTGAIKAEVKRSLDQGLFDVFIAFLNNTKTTPIGKIIGGRQWQPPFFIPQPVKLAEFATVATASKQGVLTRSSRQIPGSKIAREQRHQ